MQHVMNIMDLTGHTSMSWDADDAVAVKAAKAKFDDYKAKGYTAFAISITEENGIEVEGQGRRIDRFEDVGAAAKVLLVPQLRGG
ncbi:hypothetical protein [Bradyrhizobium sp. S3.7.6]